jgi:proline dehydrogenase
MLRSFFIYLSKADWAKNIAMNWPIAWKAASRFIAGEKLEDAINVIQVLNKQGINATLDHLGENTTTQEEAVKSSQSIIEILDTIDRSGVRSNVSVKLSQIGMGLDDALCQKNLIEILRHAETCHNFIRIDMEDSSCVDFTFRLYHKMRTEYGFSNVGLVIQSYLYRSDEDIRNILKLGGKVRLCKGAYREPAEIAYPEKKDVDQAYDRQVEMLIDGTKQAGNPTVSDDGKIPPIASIASHDPIRLTNAKNYVSRQGIPKTALEFQMLHGIRRDLQELTAKEGYPVRIYVPYGTHWYPYFVRRLAERPANVWFFISNFFRK